LPAAVLRVIKMPVCGMIVACNSNAETVAKAKARDCRDWRRKGLTDVMPNEQHRREVCSIELGLNRFGSPLTMNVR